MSQIAFEAKEEEAQQAVDIDWGRNETEDRG